MLTAILYTALHQAHTGRWEVHRGTHLVHGAQTVHRWQCEVHTSSSKPIMRGASRSKPVSAKVVGCKGNENTFAHGMQTEFAIDPVGGEGTAFSIVAGGCQGHIDAGDRAFAIKEDESSEHMGAFHPKVMHLRPGG